MAGMATDRGTTGSLLALPAVCACMCLCMCVSMCVVCVCVSIMCV
jgi:hypothetical protein